MIAFIRRWHARRQTRKRQEQALRQLMAHPYLIAVREAFQDKPGDNR